MSRWEQPGSSRTLDDPLAGLSRPRGDPAGVRSRCADFRSAAAQLEDIGALMGVYTGGVVAHWRGNGATAFVARVSTLPRSYKHVAAGYRIAAGALDAYADALASTQLTFDQAVALVVADDKRQNAIMAADPHAVADPLAPDRIRARRMLESALEHLKAASQGAVRTLRYWEAGEGRRPPVRPDIYRGKSSSLHQAWDGFRDAGAEALHDLWSSLPHMNVISQPIDYYREAQRMRSDPAGYIESQAYDTFDLGNLEAGNEARWFGGMAVRLPERILEKRLGRLSHEPHGRGDGHDDKAGPWSWTPPADSGPTPPDPVDDDKRGDNRSW